MNREDDEENTTQKLGRGLSHTIGSENLTNSLTNIGDAGLNVATAALGGVPVLGALVSMYRAASSVKDELEFKKNGTIS